MQRDSRETEMSIYYFKMETLKLIFHSWYEVIAVIMHHMCHKMADPGDEKICVHSNCSFGNAKIFSGVTWVWPYEPCLNLNHCRVYLLPSGQLCSTQWKFSVTCPFVKRRNSIKWLWHDNKVYLSKLIANTVHDSVYRYVLLFCFIFIPERKIQMRWKNNNYWPRH